MYKNSILAFFCTLFTWVGLTAQNAGPEPTAFTFLEDKSALQQLMAISESNPHVKEFFFLEELPEIEDRQIHIGTATGPNSFAYGNMTVAELYAKILQVPTDHIYVDDGLNTQRYNLFYHSGGQILNERLRHQIAQRFLERIDIEVSEDDSLIMDRLVFRATPDLEKSIAQRDEKGTAWVHHASFRISLRNHSISRILTEIQKHPLFSHYQFVDQTGLSEEQTFDVDLSTESIDDFIASAAEQGLEIRIDSDLGRKVHLKARQ